MKRECPKCKYTWEMVEPMDERIRQAEATIERFGNWLDRWSINSYRKFSDVYGAWDEARDPGCHGGKFIAAPSLEPTEKKEPVK